MRFPWTHIDQRLNKKPGQEPHLSRLSEHGGDDIIVE